MGQNIQTVRVVDGDGDPVVVNADGFLQTAQAPHVGEDILVANVTISSAASTNNTVISAPGANTRIVLVGYVITIDAASKITLHWGTTASDEVVTFNYIADGGVAYHFGAYGPKGASNEALTVDNAATTAYEITVYYYTEAV